jgi:hypothetical protein
MKRSKRTSDFHALHGGSQRRKRDTIGYFNIVKSFPSSVSVVIPRNIPHDLEDESAVSLALSDMAFAHREGTPCRQQIPEESGAYTMRVSLVRGVSRLSDVVAAMDIGHGYATRAREREREAALMHAIDNDEKDEIDIITEGNTKGKDKGCDESFECDSTGSGHSSESPGAGAEC